MLVTATEMVTVFRAGRKPDVTVVKRNAAIQPVRTDITELLRPLQLAGRAHGFRAFPPLFLSREGIAAWAGSGEAQVIPPIASSALRTARVTACQPNIPQQGICLRRMAEVAREASSPSVR